MMNAERLTKQQAFQKLKQYCAYQERCHSEVKNKLYNYGLNTPEVDETISMLIEENYLNEERFAIQFAGGKFRVKHWGRNKIKYELKGRQVSDYCIKKALLTIPADDYYSTLQLLCSKKWQTLRTEKNRFTKLRKAQDYLIQKGYESSLVQEVVKDMETNPDL